MTARKAIGYYWLWTAVLTAVLFAMPSWYVLVWAMIGGSSVACVLVGVRRNQPRRRMPWFMVAAGLLTFVVGDTVYNVLATFGPNPNPYPSAADGIYLTMYPLMVAGFFGLARSGARGRDWANLLDSLIVTTAVALLAWVFLIGPHLRDPDLGPLQKLVSASYPIGDVLLVAVIAGLVTMARNTPAVLGLTVGGIFLLASDAVYGLIQIAGTWRIGSPIDAGWIVSYGAFGAAALHPSMTRLTEVKLPTQRLTSGRRMVMLAVFSLIPSVVLLVEVVRGAVRDGAVIAILSGLTFLLVYFRLVGVVDMHRKAFTRERVLRRAGAALVSATEIGQVDAAIRVALGELLPAYRLVLLLSPAEEPQPGDRCVAVGPSTVSVTPSGGGSTLRRVEELGPRVAERIEGFETALICPLVVEDRLSGDIQVGMIVLAAPEDALVGLEGAVDVLASQSAMAVERIGLCDEIYRRRSEEYFRTLVHNMSDVILILEDDDTVRYASPAAATLFGPDELVGRSLYDLLHPRERPGARRAVAAARGERAASQEPAGGDWNVLPSGGKRAQVEVSFQDLRGDQTVRGLVVTMRDVTERRRLERELTHQAYHDALTGLANRILFTQRMHQAIAGAVRTGQVIGVLIVDLDDFKIINDTMGHGCGDELLASVGRRLISAVRPRDTVARLGGDEFAILMRDAGEEAEVERLADQVLATFVEPVTLGGQIITCAASVGLTTSREMADDGQELLRQADLALYMAKSSGKGRAVLYQPELHSAIRQRLELRAELDQSLNDGDFVLYYQPIVDLATGEPVGVEALVRWIHPAKGLVHPGQFIDVAEESGLIVPLGAWVLREAIAAIARWHSELPNGRMLYLSVNVSASQFRAPDFVDQVMEFLKQYDVAPRYLLLEITESLLLRDDDRVWTDLLALRSAGVRVAIDDFGTGYSSLSYLRQVPIDIVKIDKSFVETVSTSQQQRALVDGIIGLTRTLGLEVVAEGIEESTEREVLCEIGCPLGQGFLFAQPMSYGDAIQWMRAIEVAA